MKQESQDLSNESLAKTASSRAKAYRILASIYLKPPTRQILAELLRELPLPVEFQGMKDLTEFLSQNTLMPPELLEENLAKEHLRLFGGVTPGYGPPPPYESVWSGEGKLMGKTTADVLRQYAEAGMEPGDHLANPPDHIGLELAYLSILCSKQAEAQSSNDVNLAEKYLNLETKFVRDHMERWVPSFVEEIASNDKTGFYQVIAILTKELLLADTQTSGKKPSEGEHNQP